jgi:hypothetical protein
MRYMRPHFITSSLCLTLLAPAHVTHAAPPVAETVILTGWLQAFDLNMSDISVEVIVHGRQRHVPVSECGRFTVVLPIDTEALLRIGKPGHLAKELLVDTHNASLHAARRQHVKFGVILDLQRHMAGLAYAGPVASITFDRLDGALHVIHTRDLVPQGSIMEF